MKRHSKYAIDNKEVGLRIRMLRINSGLLQSHFCKALDISQSKLSRFENGQARPSDDQLDCLVAYTGAPSDFFARPDLLTPKIAGTASAGFPTDRYPDELGTLSDIIPMSQNVFVVKVSGYSMEPTINDGDYVVVDSSQRDPKALHNHVVCARVEDEEHVIKRLVYETGCYYLKSDNPQYPLIPVRANTEIEGKVTNIIKKL